MFHTQQKRRVRLLAAIPCDKDNAWLGTAMYFWGDEMDAMHWGRSSKKGTGEYEIYKAEIETSNCLDTVFNEEHYYFWIEKIEKAVKKFTKAGSKISLKIINDYFYEKEMWSQFDGIIFQDISNNPENTLVPGLQYKKRIQVAVYKESIINNFTFHMDGKCD